MWEADIGAGDIPAGRRCETYLRTSRNETTLIPVTRCAALPVVQDNDNECINYRYALQH